LPHQPQASLDFGGRTFGRWVRWVLGVVVAVVTTMYLSLLLTSDGLTPEERTVVMDAIALLESRGFEREVRPLRRVVSFRRTDNWWNAYVGHDTAYASTNFPFGVVTLYPAFFRYPLDDVERAAILLHEAYHVYGEREEVILQRVWLRKRQLGWTGGLYGDSRVWKNTREWTAAAVPPLFACGRDGRSDCLD
jgi:hypothetical protein